MSLLRWVQAHRGRALDVVASWARSWASSSDSGTLAPQREQQALGFAAVDEGAADEAGWSKCRFTCASSCASGTREKQTGHSSMGPALVCCAQIGAPVSLAAN